MPKRSKKLTRKEKIKRSEIKTLLKKRVKVENKRKKKALKTNTEFKGGDHVR